MQRVSDVKLTQPINCISLRFLNNLAINHDVKLQRKWRLLCSVSTACNVGVGTGCKVIGVYLEAV